MHAPFLFPEFAVYAPAVIHRWGIAQQERNEHRRKTRAEHGQKQGEAFRHLGNQDDTGNRSAHDGGEKRRHANYAEYRGIGSHVGHPSGAESAKEKTALRPQDKHGREQSPGVPAA